MQNLITTEMYKPVHGALEAEYFCIIFIRFCPLSVPSVHTTPLLHGQKTFRIRHLQGQGSALKVKILQRFYGFFF